MKIEILFPEFCNLFGDISNMRYLQKCLPDAEFLETAFEDTPQFVSGKMDLIYLGPMTERTQEKVIKKFQPFRERIKSLIQDNTVFLFTGNALEVLGNYIETEDGRRIDGLGLLPLHAKRDMMHRHNSTFLGKFQGTELMGFKSQFTMAYLEESAVSQAVLGLFQVEKGIGLHKGCPYEGVRVQNFFGTYLLGPVLILNPDFAKSLLSCMGVDNPVLAFEEEARSAYAARLKDFRKKT